ncbi:MAG: TrkA family potassium uptake protein [Candidatus Aureabacteria bacterium]|mgnify:FL=1|nr:TrkA family potassium uptake protein [Candidatus Auribacterota bacterium]NLW93081.1 TrkA family potassium uptake protein [Chlamydiota bacterium]HOE27101.1 TrkA family potassium uptake protein [bacterium]HQM53514.1 TrkA family potassium uptake protein [bacterium]
MKQFAVIGAGRFGASVAKTLSEQGCDVILIDNNAERLRALDDLVTQAIELDATDEKALAAAGIAEVDAVVLALGRRMEESILITMLLKEMGIKQVIVKATSEAHYKILTRIGADRIVFPEREMGVKVANSLINPTILDYIEVAPGYNIIETRPPEDIVGKSLEESKARSRYGVDIIALKRMKPVLDAAGDSRLEEEVTIVPHAHEVINENDTIIVIGREDLLAEFRR